MLEDGESKVGREMLKKKSAQFLNAQSDELCYHKNRIVEPSLYRGSTHKEIVVPILIMFLCTIP